MALMLSLTSPIVNAVDLEMYLEDFTGLSRHLFRQYLRIDLLLVCSKQLLLYFFMLMPAECTFSVSLL